MGCFGSRCENERSGWGRSVACVGLSILATVGMGHAGESDPPKSWGIDPWFNISSGYEDESLVDPDLNLGAVPGGPFVSFLPGARFARGVGERNSLVISVSGSAEQFFNDENRLLFGLSAWSEFKLRSSGKFYGSVLLGADFFDDSEFETLGRAGLNGRAIAGLGSRNGGAELILAVRGRRYGDLITDDEAGIPGVYSELTGSLGAAVHGWVARRLFMRGEVTRLTTDARDPLFDSSSWYVKGDARVTAGSHWSIWLSALYQDRAFDKRAAEFDSDDYSQVGVRVVRQLRRGSRIGLSVSAAEYGLSDGQTDSSNRISVFYHIPFGRSGPPTVVRAVPTQRPVEFDPVVRQGRVRFRIHSSDANRVAVTGDFNGWDPEAHLLVSVGGGWWELTLPLSSGNYQYLYLIDEVWVVPPRSEFVLDDGFGGENGYFAVSEN